MKAVLPLLDLYVVMLPLLFHCMLRRFLIQCGMGSINALVQEAVSKVKLALAYAFLHFFGTF